MNTSPRLRVFSSLAALALALTVAAGLASADGRRGAGASHDQPSCDHAARGDDHDGRADRADRADRYDGRADRNARDGRDARADRGRADRGRDRYARDTRAGGRDARAAQPWTRGRLSARAPLPTVMRMTPMPAPRGRLVRGKL
ncbi:MAG: hypothetical protein IPL61_18620 [Myxococcales bacterium]|nr:hypothetical protein [Myxococcales bacterium]